MLKGRLPRALAGRLAFLAAGNLALILAIALTLREGGSLASALRRSTSDVAPTALAALGMTGVICAGGIDLSVASAIAVAGTLFGALTLRGAPPALCWLACFGAAFAISNLNGALVGALGVPAIIVTLAGLAFYRGAALILADLTIPNFGGNISVPDEAYHLPGKLLAGWILAAAVAAALFWEANAKTPRQWLALGASEEACRLAGLDPGRVRRSAFMVGGIFLGLAAVISATRIQAIEPSRMAVGFELEVIGAVVLGGTNIFGGEGCYAGSVLGAFFLYFTSQALTYAGVSPYFQEAVTGAVILGVIGLDCALHRKRKRLDELA